MNCTLRFYVTHPYLLLACVTTFYLVQPIPLYTMQVYSICMVAAAIIPTGKNGRLGEPNAVAHELTDGHCVGNWFCTPTIVMAPLHAHWANNVFIKNIAYFSPNTETNILMSLLIFHGRRRHSVFNKLLAYVSTMNRWKCRY